MSGEVIGVTGGTHGLAAAYDEVRDLADRFDDEGDRLREHAAATLRVARDGELLESGVLSPMSCAAAEEALLALATAAGRGSLAWESGAVAVRGTVEVLEHADDAVRLSLTGLAQSLVVPVGAAALLDPDLLEEHPDLAQLGVGSLLPLVPLLAGAYGPPGRPVVTPFPGTTPAEQPETVQDLLAHLQQVAALSADADSPGNGTIEVQTLVGADGQVRHIVYLPGTDDFFPGPGEDDVRDLDTDAHAMAGLPDSYQQGILEAMAQAGIRPGEPVMVVGHSLGGMEAAALAAHHHGYAITDVVTAGAPTAQVGTLPDDVNVLSLEQVGDAVPMLDGQPNPDSVQQTTVTFDADPPSGLVNHHQYSDTYVPGAALVDQSTDPSVLDSIGSMHQHGFLGQGAAVSSQTLQISEGG